MTETDTNAISKPSTLDAQKEIVKNVFRERFSADPTCIVAAPGRVNLIGEHIDYNDGFVLPMAIQRYVVIASRPNAVDAVDADAETPESGVSRFYSVDLDQEFAVDTASLPAPAESDWSNYVVGVLAGWIRHGVAPAACNAVIQSAVPIGGGLSSSAALEVATATLLESLNGTKLDPTDKALLCQQAEHQYAGVPCGIMDQFSSVFGQEDSLMLLDCRSQKIELVPFAAPDISVLITNSNVKHELSGGEYAQRRSQCDSALQKLEKTTWRDVTTSDLESSRESLSEVEYQRARHVVTEIARTVDAAKAIRNSDWSAMGELMYGSHESLRDDYEVSCDELDILVEIVRDLGVDHGVIGSRMTGGGFGGCTVTLVRSDMADAVMRQVQSRYRERTNIDATSFVTRPARGAHVVSETTAHD